MHLRMTHYFRACMLGTVHEQMICQDLVHKHSICLQVLQLTLAGLYGLVALSAAAGWLPAACFGALCLASPVVSACHL